MVTPQTQLEIDGDWTSLEYEQVFLQQVANDTGAVLTVAGLSDEGRPIHRIEIGNPNGTTLALMTLVHGREKASREGVLAWFRDLAYSTDPAIVEYLSNNRVTLITPVSPDGFLLDSYGVPAGDINKDYLTFNTEPAKAVTAALRDLDPHLVVDCHEFRGNEESDYLAYFETALLAVDHRLRDLSVEACEAIHQEVSGEGYPVGRYTSPGRVSGREMGAWFHATSILIETHSGLEPTERVHLYSIALRAVQKWHAVNAGRLKDAKDASRATAARNEPIPYILQTGDVVSRGNWYQISLPERLVGYEVTGDLPLEVMDAYGMTATGNFVSMSQEARALVPILFDPLSDDVSAEAIRVLDAPTYPMPTTPRIGRWVKDGIPRPLTYGAVPKSR